VKISPIDQSKLAKTGQEYLYLLASDADWIAPTADDVKQLRAAGNNAFAKLPERDFDAFHASLEFKRGGIAHGYYRPLMFSLTLTEVFEVFAYFGMSINYANETQEAKCIAGQCKFEFWSFCTSSCVQAKEP
jgi:hypothetical protein